MATLALVFAMSAGGCAFFRGADKPTAVDVTLTAAPRLNQDESGEPLPTMFRIQLLGSASKAESASYEDLYRSDKETLGEDLLAIEEVVLSPGETAKKRIVSEKPARALLVVGVFRKPAGTSWRVIVPMNRGKPRRVAFRAEDYRVDRQ
jgi:type VI secretion system protein VasD